MTAKQLALVVEDTQDIGDIVRMTLETMGFEAFHATTPDQALAYLSERAPALLVLDINLPGMTGWQLLEIIKNRRETNQMRVLVTTALSDPANRVVGKLQSVDHYLTKPFDLSQLRKAVTQVMHLS
jgi:DNA-binding response OmpR family regulator